MTPSSTDISRAASSHSGHEQEDKKSTKTASDTIDGEKAAAVAAGQEVHDVEAAEVRPLSGPRALLLRAQAGLLAGVEVRGMSPVPPEERTVTRYSNVFSIWFCISVSLLPITFGILGPLSYGLTLRDSSLVILFVTLACTTAPAYLATLGPRTGMRQMIQARFSFGRHLTSIPVLLNLATLTGFCVIMSVVGGQTLSAASSSSDDPNNTSISPDLGIALIAVLALLVSFCGFRVLHAYERYAWMPALVALAIAAGCGGKQFAQAQAQSVVVVVEGAASSTAVSAASVVSFAGIVASYMLPWAPLASDFTTYISPQAPSWKIALYTYLGLSLPTILLMTLGAAMGTTTPQVPTWAAAYDALGVGGILVAMLTPVAGLAFGRFVAVVLAFTLLGNMAATTYSITLNLQMLAATFSTTPDTTDTTTTTNTCSLPSNLLHRIPRALFALVITAIVIPVGIRAAASGFFASLENFVALIGYWSASFVAVVVAEHLVFRGGDCASYDLAAWDASSELPPGVAAVAAAVLSYGLVVPGMAQVWYVGPIAETTGDIGLELALVVGAVLYVPLRALEKRIAGR